MVLYWPHFSTGFLFLCRANHDFTLSEYLHKAVKHTSDFTSHTQCRLSGFILSLSELKKKKKKAVKVSYFCWFSLP